MKRDQQVAIGICAIGVLWGLSRMAAADKQIDSARYMHSLALQKLAEAQSRLAAAKGAEAESLRKLVEAQRATAAAMKKEIELLEQKAGR